jgi:glycosyltransferase involved in cell wall biosynthesis
MAMGKAVVATASPGVADYVKDGVTGRVVPVGDSEAMRRAIAELWEDPARCAAIGRHNRRYAEEVLSMDSYARRVAGLFGVRPRNALPSAAVAG